MSEPATVTVQAQPGLVSADNRFEGQAQMPSGTSTVAVAATDASGNTRTNTYQVSLTGASKTLAYDASGNLESDGTRTFEWDAENRLVAVAQGTRRSEFSYDGFFRRTRVVEKDGGITLSDRRLLWCETEICEERDGGGGSVTRRFFRSGMKEGADSFFYTRDYVGSIREVIDSIGQVRARYDYDPWGRMTKVSGDKASVSDSVDTTTTSPAGCS